eukprot:gene10614-1930_t
MKGMCTPGTRSAVGSTVNMINTIIGSGVLGVPYAFSRTGWLAGLVVLAAMGTMAVGSVRLMMLSTILAPREIRTYEDLGALCLGRPWGKWWTEFNIFFINFGASISYVQVIRDSFPPSLCDVLGTIDSGFVEEALQHPAGLTLALVVTVITPLSLLKRMDLLQAPSCLSLLLYGTFVACLVYRAVVPSPTQSWQGQCLPPSPASPVPRSPIAVFLVIPIFSLAYSCHSNVCQAPSPQPAFLVFPVYNEMKPATPTRMFLVASCAIVMCGLVYAVVGMAGYASFSGSTCGNIMNNFPPDDHVMTTVRLLFTLSICFTFPLVIFPARRALCIALADCFPSLRPDLTLYIVALVLVGACTAIALLVPLVEIIFTLTGNPRPVSEHLLLCSPGFGSAACYVFLLHCVHHAGALLFDTGAYRRQLAVSQWGSYEQVLQDSGLGTPAAGPIPPPMVSPVPGPGQLADETHTSGDESAHPIDTGPTPYPPPADEPTQQQMAAVEASPSTQRGLQTDDDMQDAACSSSSKPHNSEGLDYTDHPTTQDPGSCAAATSADPEGLQQLKRLQPHWAYNVLAVIVMLFGMLTGILGTILDVQSIVQSHTIPPFCCANVQCDPGGDCFDGSFEPVCDTGLPLSL